MKNRRKAIILGIIAVLIAGVAVFLLIDQGHGKAHDQEQYTTRGAWIQQLVHAYGYTQKIQKDTPSYTDIKGTRYEQAVETAVAFGMLKPDGKKFHPNAPADREFAAETAVRSLGYEMPTTEISCDDEEQIADRQAAQLVTDLKMLKLEKNKYYPTRKISIEEQRQILEVVTSTMNSTKIDKKDHQGLVYKKGIVQITKDMALSDDGTTLLLPLTDQTKKLKSGDFLVLSDEKAFELTAIQTTADTLRATYTTPSLADVLDKIDVQGESALDFSKFEPAEGVSLTVDNGATNQGMSAPSQEAATKVTPMGFFDNTFDVGKKTIAANASVSLKGTVDLGDGYAFDFSTSTKVPEISYKLDIDFGGSPAVQVKNAFVKVKQEASVDAALSNSFSSKGENDKPQLEKEIKLGSVPVVGLKGLGLEIELDLVTKVSGELKIEYKLTGQSGVQVLHNKLRNLSALDSSTQVTADASISAGPELKAVASVLGQDVLDFSASAGGKLSGKATVRDLENICMDGTMSLYLDLSANRDSLIGDWLKLEADWPVIDEDNSPIKKHLHIENMKIVKKCTWDDAKGSGSNDSTKSTMDFNQIKSGDFSSLVGEWAIAAIDAKGSGNNDAFEWQPGPEQAETEPETGDSNNMFITKERIGTSFMMIEEGQLFDQSDGSTQPLTFSEKDGVLMASLQEQTGANDWIVYFYPKGTNPNLGLADSLTVDTTKDLIVLWTSYGQSTYVFTRN